MVKEVLARSQIVPGRVRSSLALGRAAPSAVRGQSSTVFAILIVALSFMMMLGVFAISSSFKTKTTKTIDLLFVEAISDKVLLTLVEMKQVINVTDTRNFTRIVSVPPQIGDRTYVIAGIGDRLEVRTLDRNAIFIQTNVSRVWPSLNLTGATGSSGGKINLDYIRGRNEIRIG